MLFPKIWIICRVCLKQEAELFNLFDNAIVKNISSILRDCGGVSIRKNDDLPDKICKACLGRLWIANNFRIDCQRGHRELLQMIMQRNAILYEIDLEDEYKYCSEFMSISNTNNEYHPPSSLLKLEPNISNNPNKNHFDTPTITKENDTVENQSSNRNSKQCNRNTKQYCVVSQNDENEKTQEITAKTNRKNPIVLLLRLKNIPHARNPTKANETDAATKTTPNLQTKKGTEKNGSKKTEINEKSEFENKIIKTKRIANLKTKLIKNTKLSVKNSKHTCKVCKKSFKTYVLLRHHNYSHKRPHQCKICNKAFGQIQAFLNHNNLHTGIQPYYCRICFNTFSDISNRNKHERNSHTKQEFKCEICNKVFRFAALLEKHAQSHRPKKCFICNKELASLQMVRSHHQRKHLKFLNK